MLWMEHMTKRCWKGISSVNNKQEHILQIIGGTKMDDKLDFTIQPNKFLSGTTIDEISFEVGLRGR